MLIRVTAEPGIFTLLMAGNAHKPHTPDTTTTVHASSDNNVDNVEGEGEHLLKRLF